MITKPPPKESAPTLKAVQARAPIPPVDAAAASSSGRAPARSRVPAGPGPTKNLEQAAGHQHEHQVRPDHDRRRDTGDQVGEPAKTMAMARHRVLVAGPDQLAPGAHGDRRDGGAGAGPGSPHPVRRRRRQEEHRERQHHDDRGHDEAEAADHRTRRATDAIGAEDRELGRRWTGEQRAGRVRVLEGTGVHPALPAHHQVAEQADVRGRAPESDQTDPQPLPGDHAQRGHAAGSYLNGMAERLFETGGEAPAHRRPARGRAARDPNAPARSRRVRRADATCSARARRCASRSSPASRTRRSSTGPRAPGRRRWRGSSPRGWRAPSRSSRRSTPGAPRSGR